MLAVAGVTAMDDSTAAVTVNCAVPALPVAGSVAVIVIGPPVVLDVARPLSPAALLMVATTVLEDDQVTDEVRSCVVWSE